MRRAGVVAAVLCGVGVSARAETDDEKLRTAIEDYRQGEWDRAASVLRAVAPRLKAARARAEAFKFLGLAEIERGQSDGAKAAFREALVADPLVELDPVKHPPAAVEAFRSVHEKLTGHLAITADHGPARVFIDGVDRGALPFDGKVKVGKRSIRVVTNDGHFTKDVAGVVVHAVTTATLALTLEAAVAFLVVQGTPGAEVLVDGKPVGTVPLARTAVPTGVLAVAVRFAGHVEKKVEVNFKRGKEHAVDGVLVPVAAQPPKMLEGDKAKDGKEVETPAVSPVRRKTKAWAWITLGVGLAALGAGSVFYATSAPAKSERETYVPAVNDFNTKIGVGGAMLITGLSLCVTSTVLFIVSRGRAPESNVVAPAALPQGMGGVAFSF